ncbi:hypothetical protein RYX36_009467 [Vicia faba]
MSSSNDLRSQAENISNLCKQTYPDSLILKLVQLLHTSPNPETRTMSTILLRRHLTRHHDDSFIYPHLTASTQSTLRSLLLSSLHQEPVKSIAKKLCDTVSELASALLSEDFASWPDLLPLLFQLFTSPDSRLQEISLLVFAQLAHYIGETLIPQLSTLHSVFLRSLSAATSSSDVRIAALAASINFVQCLSNPSDRDRGCKEHSAMGCSLSATIAPLIHEWTYDAMCHDLLNMEGNKYVHEIPGKNGGQPERKEVLLEDHDPIWLELRYAHIADMLSCRVEVQSELLQQVLLFMLQNKHLGMVQVCEFLKPLLDFSIIRLLGSESPSSSFGLQLVSSMASFCCSCPSESMPVLMLLTECLKYLPHETSEDYRKLVFVVEHMVEAYIVVLKSLAGEKLGSPYPGQKSLQRVIIFGDMGKAERDGSNEYADYQPGSLNTTDQLIKDLDNFDIVFHIGDLPYANGYISQWDQFTAQVQEISSTVPYMIASGNHERDWPNTGSFFNTPDSGGECGVPAETMYYYPAENKAKFWYATDYGMFRFCIADSEHDWREGSEQYKFIENCLATVDRKQQPWLIFAAHRPLGYSSNSWYAMEGSFEEPMGRESLQGLWQKYKVDIAFYGHVHNYERVCPIYQNQCVNKEKYHYSGTVNGTIHVVVGGGGSHLSDFTASPPVWSIFRDRDYGFGKLTAFNHSYLLFEYPSMYSRKGFTTICQFAINFV